MQRGSREARFLLPLIGAALLGGCTARPTLTPPTLAARPTIKTAEELIRAAGIRRAAIHGMRSLARLAYTSPEESRRAKQVIVVARPDRLRIEVLSPLGTMFVLTTDRGQLSAYTRSEGTMYRGKASAANLQRYTQVDLPVATAIDLLLGTPPLREEAISVLSQDGGYTKLWQAVGDAVYVTWFLPNLDAAQYEQRDGEGRVRLRATFGEYAERQGVRLPTELDIELPGEHRQVEIELSDPEVNPLLADSLFALETPPGSKEIDIDQVLN